MALFRLQGVSYGIYSGNSFHIDSREFGHWPARWMAIRPSQESQLTRLGLGDLIGSRTDGWTYLKWSHPRAHEGLHLVLTLANQAAGVATDV